MRSGFGLAEFVGIGAKVENKTYQDELKVRVLCKPVSRCKLKIVGRQNDEPTIQKNILFKLMFFYLILFFFHQRK